MDKAKQTPLAEWLQTVPSGEISYIRVQIKKRCKISKYVLSYWISGRTAVPELAKPIINDIAGHTVYEFNGDAKPLNV